MAINARSVLLLSAEFARRFSGSPGSGRIVNFTSSALFINIAKEEQIRFCVAARREYRECDALSRAGLGFCSTSPFWAPASLLPAPEMTPVGLPRLLQSGLIMATNSSGF